MPGRRARWASSSGSNTRVEIWHSTAAAPVSQVTANLSAADIVSADVSEWSGVATAQPVMHPAGQGTPRG